MGDHLSASELADLVGCKPNQRARMARWLDDNRWRYYLDVNGMPKVARAHYHRKMGVTEEIRGGKYEDSPNLEAFL